METLKIFIQIEVWFFLLGLASILIYRLLTGKINTTGMLSEKGSTNHHSPGRVQLLSAGLKEYTWDGKDTMGNPMSSGVYLYRLKTGKRSLTKRMILVR